MAGRLLFFAILFLTALNGALCSADVVEDSENRVLKSLKVVVSAVDVTEEAAKIGLSSEVVAKEVSMVLKTAKVEEAKPEAGKARPVLIVKLYLGKPYKKIAAFDEKKEGGDGASDEDEPTRVAPKAAVKKTKTEKADAKDDTKTTAKGTSAEDQIAGYLQVRIADLAKIDRLGDKPVSVTSFERIYPFLARPRSKVKDDVIKTLIGKTFKRDFRGLIKAARASGLQ